MYLSLFQNIKKCLRCVCLMQMMGHRVDVHFHHHRSIPDVTTLFNRGWVFGGSMPSDNVHEISAYLYAYLLIFNFYNLYRLQQLQVSHEFMIYFGSTTGHTLFQAAVFIFLFLMFLYLTYYKYNKNLIKNK